MGENVRGHNIIMSVGWNTVLGYTTKSPKKRIIIKRPEVARQRNYNTASGRRSILAFMGVLVALVGPPAWAQTWPSPADLRDFALAEAHETKLDARVRRHRPSPGKELSTAFIEDTLAVSQFRTIARAAKIWSRPPDQDRPARLETGTLCCMACL